MEFEDHFSRLSKDYARYRPGYPDELFRFLAQISPGRELAWDCGTGNGQAAVGLSKFFRKIIATDASPDQIAHAYPHEKVEYRVERSEDVSIASSSCDLVTVAVAVHWFELDLFYAKVKRVLKPGGVLAVWTYHLPRVEPGIDQVVLEYYRHVLSGYWPERIHYLDERYQTLPFPFEEIPTPVFKLQAEWDLNQLVGFLASWSAAQRYYEQEGHHPLEKIWKDLSRLWGEPSKRRALQWPLFLRAGR